jgi:hypothetical protein
MLAGTLIALLIASFVMLMRRNWRELDDGDDLKTLASVFALRNAKAVPDKARI